ncbi:DUF2169 family type VI secretion system accessory protein [Polyangium fumosum]|uniref:DUF2169 family type VI secretion system accessory protein n=1 Tax=Polyangium fumosum TaxID=889272 RepID=UPI00147822A9|nr:DUF2169 domain-containing protein [Polyangium fumosum]
MKIRNRTPFSPYTFQTLDTDDDPFQVVIAKGTFDIVPDAPLSLSAEQDPIRTCDTYWDNQKPSSLRWEDDLAPFKPCTDVVVNATAYAPSGRPSPEWLAGITIGDRAKRVLVTGTRAWAYAPLVGWSLGPVTPVTEMPIRYEHAFGGFVERDGIVEVHQQNPVGVGFVDRRRLHTAQTIPAPTILSPDGRVPVLGEPYPVEGLSAIAKPWLPRRARAGSFDDAWVKNRHPRLPHDFGHAFYNCAHPDLMHDGFLRGDEEIRLERLHRAHEILVVRLPSLVVAVAIVDRDDYRYGSPARLDTLHIDAERSKAILTWRAVLPLYKHGIRYIDIAMRESLEAVIARATGSGSSRGDARDA